jgi:hypothetical protein
LLRSDVYHPYVRVSVAHHTLDSFDVDVNTPNTLRYIENVIVQKSMLGEMLRVEPHINASDVKNPLALT